MRAQVITQFGDTTVFKSVELPKPALKPGHVLIKVHASSVNPVDYKIRSGRFSDIAPVFPAVLHGDVAGLVEEIGEGVEHVKKGDEVFGCAGGVKGEGGALADYMLVDAALIAKKPASLSMIEAAALPLVCITAWEGLFDKIKILPGQKVLIHAGTGGVGHVGIQLAKWAGADVYTTVSSEEKATLAKSLGATDTINYRQESVESYVKRLTDGKGFDVVFDTIGGDNIDQSIKAVAPYGHVVTIMALSTHDLSPLFLKAANLHVVFMLLPMLYQQTQQRKQHGDILKQIAKLVDSGQLIPLIDSHQFSFEEVGQSHARLESGQAIGKVVLSNH